MRPQRRGEARPGKTAHLPAGSPLPIVSGWLCWASGVRSCAGIEEESHGGGGGIAWRPVDASGTILESLPSGRPGCVKKSRRSDDKPVGGWYDPLVEVDLVILEQPMDRD